jgi:hypothetical protein
MPHAVALTLVLALFVTGHANSASATTFLLSNTTPASTGGVSIGNAEALAIKFTTTSNGFSLTGVGATLATTTTNPTGNLFLEVLNNAVDRPGSSLLLLTISTSDLIVNNTTPTFYGKIVNNLALQPNTDYWLAVDNQLNESVSWRFNGQTSAVGFPTETSAQSFGSASWNDPVSTSTTALIGSITAVPEPSSGMVLWSFTGLTGGIALCRRWTKTSGRPRSPSTC